MEREADDALQSDRFTADEARRSRWRPGRAFEAVRPNISDLERSFSVIGGTLLTLAGLARGTLGGLAWAALGGNLVYRGITGYSNLYDALEIGTSKRPRGPSSSVPTGRGIRVERTLTVNRPADELFSFWRNFENLPRIFRHVETVRILDATRSHWVMRGPAQLRLEWDAEIVHEQEPTLIGWRALPNADIEHAGSVHFRQLPAGKGTEVRVVLSYDPPGGRVTDALARLFQADPASTIDDDLRNFKQVMEAGEIAHVEQPRHYGAFA